MKSRITLLRPRLVAGLFIASTFAASGCATAAATSGGTGPAGVESADPLQRVSAEQLFQRGEAFARYGDLVRAEQYLSAAMDRGYAAGRVLPLLLRVCISTSRLGAALQYATPHLRLHPDDFHLRYLVASVLLGLGRQAEARAELERVLETAPNYARAHYLLAITLRDEFAEPELAARHFAAYQRLDPRGLHGAEVAAWLREHHARAGARSDSADTLGGQPDMFSPPSAQAEPGAQP